jgi:hypothetical protein
MRYCWATKPLRRLSVEAMLSDMMKMARPVASVMATVYSIKV